MVYTTACERCRQIRIKCVRSSRGQDANQVCEPCLANQVQCVTKKRRVGRQPGVKNRQRAGEASSGYSEVIATSDIDHLPNPLHVLASVAAGGHPAPSIDTQHPLYNTLPNRTSENIIHRYAEWTDKLLPTTGHATLSGRIDELLAMEHIVIAADESPVFHGRIDIARPDASPEHDVVSLEIISLGEAEHLFSSFMHLLTNGSMYFDPRLHTLSLVRSKSSFLLAVILAIASTYKSICSSSLLHSRLMNHAVGLEAHVRNEHYKSVEIVQAFLLLASYSEIPQTLCRDRTWLYVSHATALTVELRLDAPLPYCVQTDPTYSSANHDILVRNAHRVCLLLYIHDRNMAMVAGRYPIFPESSLTSQTSLDNWGKHASAYRYDAPLCASVSLRKMVTEVHHKLLAQKDIAVGKNLISQLMKDWRKKWSAEIRTTLEYDIIARFSALMLTLALVKKEQKADEMDAEARQTCEALAFEVCCGAINNYISWQGVLNSATFDTSMVAFCAIYTMQTINLTDQTYLSDWSLFRLATLQELASQLEKQAADRHHVQTSNSMSVVDAMARQLSRGIRIVLCKKRVAQSSEVQELAQFASPPNHPYQHDQLNHLFSSNNPFMSEWNLESLRPDMMFSWDVNPVQDIDDSCVHA